MSPKPPLVLVHGLWDTPNVFRRLRQYLEDWPAPKHIGRVPEAMHEHQRWLGGHQLGALHPQCRRRSRLTPTSDQG